MKIERLSPEHISGLCAVEKECFSHPWSRLSFEAELENEFSLAFAAVENGNILGCIIANNVYGECYISKLAVSPEHRRRGIASMLLNKVAERVSDVKNRPAQIVLEVRKSNTAAINLYKKFGFTEIYEKENMYENPRENALVLMREFK